MKMNHFKIIVCILLSLCLTSKIYSQDGFSVHLGPSFPLSAFASDDIDNDNAGGAAVGLNLGVKYVYPLTTSGLGIFGGIDFNYNGLKKDIKDDIEAAYESLGIANPDVKYYKYMNIPVTAGLNYAFQPEDKIGVFANAGLALNFMKITDMELKALGQTITTEMDLTTALGLKIGGGVILKKNILLSIDYIGLVNHDLEGKIKVGSNSQDIDGEQKFSVLTLTAGFKF